MSPYSLDHISLRSYVLSQSLARLTLQDRFAILHYHVPAF
jgi:hypothetical protein